jgi:hypothetical protein
MPGYHLAGMAGRLVEYPIHPDDDHLPLSYLLRRRRLFTHLENGCPEGYQVAQNAEFRYMDSRICQYCTPIVQIRCETGSKMIANGRFWTEDRLMGQTMDPETRKNRFFRISSPAWMIQDPSHQTEGETLHVRHDPKGYSLRRRLLFTHPENRCPEGYQVAQKGEFRYIVLGIRDYRGRMGITRPETGSKMIANGRFPAGDRLTGRTAYRGIQKNPCFSGGTAECQEGRMMKTNGEPGGMS